MTEQRPAADVEFLVKKELWLFDVTTQTLTERNAEALSGNARRNVAEEVLRDIHFACSPGLRKLVKRPFASTETDLRSPVDLWKSPPPGWNYVSDAYLDHIYNALGRHIAEGISLDEAFGIAKRPGRAPKWRNFDERILAAVPYGYQMGKRNEGHSIGDDDAIDHCLEHIHVLALSSTTELFRPGRGISDTQLKAFLSKWRKELADSEAKSGAMAADLVSSFGEGAVHFIGNQWDMIIPSS